MLLSGGLDSAVTLAVAARRDGRDCFAITFDYGQRHRHELLAADRVAQSFGLGPDRRLRLSVDLRAIGGSALTDDAIDVPKSAQKLPANPANPAAIPITYVPARNLIFLSCAAGYAETLNASFIYLGVNAVDYSGYPDCREPFLRAFEAAAALGTRAGAESTDANAFPNSNPAAHASKRPHLQIESPLVHLTKPQIIRLGHELGVDFSLTHSCYDPILRTNVHNPGGPGTTLACGRCDSCRIRRAGFLATANDQSPGVPDPTSYA